MLFRAPESHPRSLVKAISWRLVGSLDTFMLSLFVTHNFVFAGSIASAETVTKIVLYYFHERAWASVPWGRPKTAAEIVETEQAGSTLQPVAITAPLATRAQ
ncbi:MAG: DUF2061 domain-containing protein [Caulobacteraceae bacterium]|nr:DUF2061 domain-containing protein [Caulobacteraceae bacterium]